MMAIIRSMIAIIRGQACRLAGETVESRSFLHPMTIMTDWIRNWIFSLAGTAMVCAAARRLTPEGRVKSVLRMVCAVAMAAALFSPLLQGALDTYPLELARYRAQAAALTEEGEALRRELDRGIIEREMEAYILDKARALGAPLQGAAVALRWSTEGVWLPASAELTGPYHAALARAIEAELGIPRSAQVWRTDESP